MGRVGDSGVGACLLLGGVGFWGLWLQGPGDRRSSACAWCVGLGPGPSGGRGHVQWFLWAQGFLRQPVWWWVDRAVSLPT